jgi:hypothetical protein
MGIKIHNFTLMSKIASYLNGKVLLEKVIARQLTIGHFCRKAAKPFFGAFCHKGKFAYLTSI